MGKSNKKAKSDRINALRKQYDAFLEEDKKRKERNDFILGRLDKMRYITALVPVRHKPITPETRPAVVDRLEYQSDVASVRDFQPSVTNYSQLFPDIPIKNNEDTYLIQEISKKYILIPKLRTTFMNNYIIRNATTNQNTERLQKMHLDGDTVPITDLKPNTNENTDWKSKYEILNILKNEEKEKQPENYHSGFVDASEHSLPKESFLGNNQHQVAIKYDDNHVNTGTDDETAKDYYISEFPEKDKPTDTLHFELPKDSQYSLNNTVCANLVPITNTNSENNVLVANVDQTGAIGDQSQNITLEYKHSNEPNIDISREVTNYFEPQPESDVNINLTSKLAEVYSKQTAQINEENVNNVEAGSHNIHGQNVSVEQHESTDSEQVVYVDDNGISPMPHLNYNSLSIPDVNDSIFEDEHSAQVRNIQEFAPNNGLQMKTDAIVIPAEQTNINSNVHSIEQAEPVTEQTENPVNITQSIEDFNAEQREMFYLELTDENYPNQEGDVLNPIEFSQNEYTQNQDYAYYENTEAEAYPVALNDEEVTQRYDPDYEQQYAGLDEGLEQQQYIQPERGTNEIDPEFEMLQYEQQFESQGKIEKTLDVEDGYIEQKHEAEAIEMPPNVEVVKTDNSEVKKVPASKQIKNN